MLFMLNRHGVKNCGWRFPTAEGLIISDYDDPENAFAAVPDTDYALYGSNPPDLSLSGDAGLTYSDEANCVWTNTPTVYTYGGPNDLWGLAWTVGMLQDGQFTIFLDNTSWNTRGQDYYNFGFSIPLTATITGIEVQVRARYWTAYGFDKLYLYYIRARVYYTR